MTGHKVILTYTGKTNMGLEESIRMSKYRCEVPRVGTAISEKHKDWTETVIVEKFERRHEGEETVFEVLARPDDRVASYVDTIADAFRANGWTVEHLR